jgi:hypothetical protein
MQLDAPALPRRYASQRGNFWSSPPRIDNKPQLDVWVRIRFDFGVRAVDGGEPANE